MGLHSTLRSSKARLRWERRGNSNVTVPSLSPRGSTHDEPTMAPGAKANSGRSGARSGGRQDQQSGDRGEDPAEVRSAKQIRVKNGFHTASVALIASALRRR